ncbi:unnamed protein product [Prunus armeniaca]
MVSRSRAGFTLNIIDTPGLIEGGYVNDMALNNIKSFLLNKTIDVLLYVDRLDAYRVDNLDKEVVKAITDSFGKGIWNRALVVLTHAQLSPPDGLPYEEFVSKRSEALLKVVRLGAGLKKQDAQASSIPVVLVENSGRCNKNEGDEKVLPNGTAWIPHLVQTITEVILSGSKSIYVDKKLIDGPNPNEKGKFLIPLILIIQVSLYILYTWSSFFSLLMQGLINYFHFSFPVNSISLPLNQLNEQSRMILPKRVDHRGRCGIPVLLVASFDLVLGHLFS